MPHPDPDIQAGIDSGYLDEDLNPTPLGLMMTDPDVLYGIDEGLLDEDGNQTELGRNVARGKEASIDAGPKAWRAFEESGAKDYLAPPAPGLGETIKDMAVMVAKGIPTLGYVAARTHPVTRPLIRGIEDKLGTEDFGGTVSAETFDSAASAQSSIAHGIVPALDSFAETKLGKNPANLWRHLGRSDELKSAARFEKEAAALELSRLDAGDQAAAYQSAADLFNPLLSSEEKLDRITKAQQKADAAFERLSPEQQKEAKELGDAGGTFMELSAPFTTAAGLSLRLGGMTAARAGLIGKEIAVLRKASADVAEKLAAKEITKQAAGTQAAHLSKQIAERTKALGVFESRGGHFQHLKDRARDAGLFAESAPGAISRAVDGAAKAAKKVSTGAGALGVLAGGPVPGVAIGLAANKLPKIIKTTRQVMTAGRVMGEEWLRRKGSSRYWQRVAERAGKNKWARNGALSMDVFSRPVNMAGKMGEAAMKSIASELPFSYLESGGEDGWLNEAIAEGLVFGAPGMVKGLGQGTGVEMLGSRADFGAMALADSQELRRILPDDAMRDQFDSLDGAVRRQLGAYTAAHPDLSIRLVSDGSGGSYNGDTKTITIDPQTKNAMAPMIAHELAHHTMEQGDTNLIHELLVGEGGFLMDKDGNLTKDAQEFKKLYEARLGNAIDNETLAQEWYAETVAPGLLNVEGLQRLVGKNSLVSSMLDPILNRFKFGQKILQKSGVLFDKNGKPIQGDNVMKAVRKSPEILAIAESFLKDAQANKMPGPAQTALGSKAKKAKKAADPGIDPAMDPNHPVVEGEAALFKKDPTTGKNARDRNGHVVGQDKDSLDAQDTAGFTIIQAVADRDGVAGVPQNNGGTVYDLSPAQWVEVFDTMEKSGWYNQVQIDNMREVVEMMHAGDGSSGYFNYGSATTRGRKGQPSYSSKLKRKARTGVPLRIKVSKFGNISVDVLDLIALEKNATKAANSAKGKKLFPGGAGDIIAAIQEMSKNHTDGKSNLDHFGREKRNFLNGIIGKMSEAHARKNSDIGKPGSKHPHVTRTFRLDRTNAVKPSGRQAMTFMADAWQENRMPEPAQLDADFAELEAKGDKATAQVLVDQAAKEAGYTVEGFHGTLPGNWSVFKIHDDGAMFATSESMAGLFGTGRTKKQHYKETGSFAGAPPPRVIHAYLKPDNYRKAHQFEFTKLKDAGIDTTESDAGVWVVRNPNQIKSADPFTYDADGKLIPLSERFNPESDNINRMPEPVSERGSVTRTADTKTTQFNGGQMIGPAAHTIQRMPEPAWHGTPHKVDRFSTAKIGTGEGNQAFGWGIYATDTRAIGEGYREGLSAQQGVSGTTTVDGELHAFNTGTPEGIAVYAMELAFDSGQTRAEWLQDARDELADFPRGFVNNNTRRETIREAKDWLEANHSTVEMSDPGNLYKLEIKPEIDEMLDWDKPLSKQSPKVRKALKALATDPSRNAQLSDSKQSMLRDSLQSFESGNTTGQTVLGIIGRGAEGSHALLAAGIRGVRYRDGYSRGADTNDAQASYNYVIFDEADIKITHENDIAR